MDVPSPVLEQVAGGDVTVTEEDEVEEIVASGGPPGQTLPPGRSPRVKVVSPAIPRRPRGQVLEERPIPRSAVPASPPSTTGVHNMTNLRGSGQTPEGWKRNSHGRLLDTWRGQRGRSTMTVHGKERPDRVLR
jgi:hypothetical protein